MDVRVTQETISCEGPDPNPSRHPVKSACRSYTQYLFITITLKENWKSIVGIHIRHEFIPFRMNSFQYGMNSFQVNQAIWQNT